MKSLKKFISFFDEKLLNNLIKRVILLHSPVSSLTIDVSGRCNLRCKMCSLDTYSTIKNRVIPFEVIDKISKELDGISKISLQCNCEPLLNPEIGHIISTLKQHKPDVKISMVTNGTMLNSKRSEELVKSGIDEIYISLDGANSQTQEKIRLGSNFNNIVQNISELNRIRLSTIDKKPTLGIITVLSKENENELENIFNLALSLKASIYVINNLEPYNNEIGDLILYGKSVNKINNATINTISNISKSNDIIVRYPSFILKNSKHCFYTNGLTIDADANVYLCPQLSYERPFYRDGVTHNHPKIILGNLNEKHLSEIINSTEYKKLRRHLLFGKLPPFCKHCLVKDNVICG